MNYTQKQVSISVNNVKIKTMELVSSCCGVSGFEYEDYGICPLCKEHCDFIDLDDDEWRLIDYSYLE